MTDPDDNPYAAPMTSRDRVFRSRGAGLTALQRMVLEHFLRYHETPPSFGSLLRNSWKVLLFIAVFFGGLGGLLTHANRAEMGWGYIGVGIGMVGFIPIGFRILVSLWPLLDPLLDWARIRRLVETPGEGPAADA